MQRFKKVNFEELEGKTFKSVEVNRIAYNGSNEIIFSYSSDVLIFRSR